MIRGKGFFIVFIILHFSFMLNAQDVLFQNLNIGLPPSARKVFLDTIQQKTGYNLLYSSILEPQKIVNIPKGEYTVKVLLDSIFSDRQLQYIVRDKLIILSPQTVQHIADEKLVVEGRVINKREQAIPFAAIYFENQSRGTIANAEGEFRFLIPAGSSSDTLTVTSLGFEEVKIPPSVYLTQKLEVQLRTISIPIKEITVRPEKPDELVMKSIRNIAKNFSGKPVLLSAFFREASLQNDEYISLTEALIEINKSSYSSAADDLIRLIKGRNGTNTKPSELVNLVVEGGLYNGLRLDIVKYNNDFYSEKALEYTDYRMLKKIVFRGRHTYIIGFNTKPNLDLQGFTGKLYIDVESFALVRAEFQVSPEGMQYARSILVKKVPRGFNAKPMHARYEVEYRFYNNCWNLFYARSELGIKVRKERGKENKGFICDFVSTSEFVITGSGDVIQERIRFKDAVGPNDVLVEQVKNTGTGFWIDDNVILPEEPLLKTINKLQQEGVIQTTDSAMPNELIKE